MTEKGEKEIKWMKGECVCVRESKKWQKWADALLHYTNHYQICSYHKFSQIK